MAATSSRRRPFTIGLPSSADGSSLILSDDEAGESGGNCALAQVGSAVLFAFMFGSLGFILTGDAQRSFLWLCGLSVGATVGTFAARSATQDSSAVEDDDARKAKLIAIAAGATTAACAYWLFIPVLTLDNLIASTVVGWAAYGSQGLSTAHGRAQMHLSALAAARDVRKMLGEVIKGGGKDVHTPSAASAPQLPVAAFTGSNQVG